jgi:hypothetical protein
MNHQPRQFHAPAKWNFELRKKEWLSDTLVDCVFDSMMELPKVQTRPAAWIELTLEKVYSWCRDNNYLDKSPEELQVLSQQCPDSLRWKETLKYGEELRSLSPQISLFYYPHLSNRHFRLFVVDIQQNSLELYNSYGHEAFTPDRVQLFANSLLWFFRVFRGVQLQFNQVIMRQQQLNGIDCGVFVILYGLLRLNGWSPERIHHEVRAEHARSMRQQLKVWCYTFDKQEKAARETLLRQKRKTKQTQVKIEGESSESSQDTPIEQTPKKTRKE